MLDLTPQVEGALIVALDDAVRNTEPQIADVPVVRSFLIDLSRESILFRDVEWRAQPKLSAASSSATLLSPAS